MLNAVFFCVFERGGAMAFRTVACLCVVLVACDAPALRGSKPISCENVGSDIDFVTYNGAWAPGMVPETAARLGPSIEALRKLDFDVLCLQEAWLPEYRDAIVGALDLPEDRVFAIDTTMDVRGHSIGETGEDVCGPGEIDELEACARKKCAGISASETSLCAQSACRGVAMALQERTSKDPACLRCIGAMAGRSIDDVHRVCTTVGASRIHGGNNDVMLLSRFPLTNKEYLMLPSSSSNRVALFATVSVPGSDVKVEVGCLHVSASSGIVKPSHSGYGSWPEEKKRQLDMVVDMLDRRAKRKGRVAVLMGDINAGPDIKNGEYTLSKLRDDDLWRIVVDAGYESPALKEPSPICTSSCPDNKTDPTKNEGSLIDHVLLRMPEKDGKEPLYPVCVDRVMDGTFIREDDDLGSVELSLSDHYGFRVKCKISDR